MDEQQEALSVEPVDLSAVERGQKRAFLRNFMGTGIVAGACEAAGISRGTHYHWLKADGAYAEAFEHAREHAADLLELSALTRARDGVRRPVLYQGVQVQIVNPATGREEPLWEHAYSDTLALALLKANRPDKFADRSKVEQDLVVKDEEAPDWFRDRVSRAEQAEQAEQPAAAPAVPAAPATDPEPPQPLQPAEGDPQAG